MARLFYVLGLALTIAVAFTESKANQKPQDISTFHAVDEGPTWIDLEWVVNPYREDIFKYTLVIDNLFSNDIACFDVACFYNATNLAPCMQHHFDLTPYYDPYNNFTLETGPTSTADDSTTDIPPNPPRNLQVTPGADGTSADLTWDAPSDPSCIVAYEVCYRISGAIPPNRVCSQSPTTSETVEGLVPCTVYVFTVNSLTTSGLVSEAMEISSSSGDAASGPPTNLTLDAITSTSATLSWDKPEINPQCVANYEVTWVELVSNEGIMEERTARVKVSEGEELSNGEFSATVSPLTSCANYSFVVYAVAYDGEQSPDSVVYGETEEVAPTDPGSISLVPNGPDSINATWTTGNAVCVGSYLVCVDDPISETENCTDVSGNGVSITGLESCTVYSISVSAVSPDGIEGNRIFSAAATDDEYPGPVENLQTINVTDSTVTIRFEPPDENAQCIDEYDIEYIDLDANEIPTNDMQMQKKSARASNTNTLTGIEACANVWVMVRGVTPHNLRGPWANTTATTLEALPSGPSNLREIGATSTSIDLSWFSPSDNSRCVDHYRIVYVSSTGVTGADQTSVVPGQYNFQDTLENLLPGTTYNIGVSGITASGQQGLTTSITAATMA